VVTSTSETVHTISLEKPASVRRSSDEGGWILPSFYAGSENRSLEYLFEDAQLQRLKDLSPIIFFGGDGVGKTCLAVTLAVRWARLHNARPLHFTTGEGYARDYNTAIEIDDVDHFHQRHRRCKLLVVDDLEPLYTKPVTQQDFLLSLDELALEKRPVIITMPRLPSVDGGALPALVSRLVGGYSVEVHLPSPPTADEILRQLIKMIDTELPVSELSKILHQQPTTMNVKDMQAFVALASQHRKFNASLDSRMLFGIAEQVSTGTIPSVPLIAKAVAKRLGIKLTDLRSSTRQSKVVRARALAIVLSRKLTTLSLQDIGDYFGGRDHSTVLHSCRKIDKLLLSDSELAAAKQDVEIELQNRRSLPL
jgi:chromosomal replication initiator protein